MNAPTLREALTELRNRIKCHPAYADLTEAQEESVGGDTAEFSYLARVADEALAQHDPLELVANLLGEYGLQAMDVVAAFKAQQGEPGAWMHTDGRVVTAATMSSARRDGGAMLSSLAGYTIPLYASPQLAPVALTGWAFPTEPQIDEYLADYEMRGEDEDGRDARHVPSDTDKAVIKDAVMGLLAEVQPAPVAQQDESVAQCLARMWLRMHYSDDFDSSDIESMCWSILGCEARAKALHDGCGMPMNEAINLAGSEQTKEPPAAVVRSVSSGKNGVNVTWLGWFPQIGMKLYAAPQPAPVAQPLTEDQARAVIKQWQDQDMSLHIDLVRMTERALLGGDK